MGFNFKIIKTVGVFIEGGYIGNLYTTKEQSDKTGVLQNQKVTYTIHGDQIGVGVKLSF